MAELRALAKDVRRARQGPADMRTAMEFQNRARKVLARAESLGHDDIIKKSAVLLISVAAYYENAEKGAATGRPIREPRIRGAQNPARPLPKVTPGPRHAEYYDDPTLSK